MFIELFGKLIKNRAIIITYRGSLSYQDEDNLLHPKTARYGKLTVDYKK